MKKTHLLFLFAIFCAFAAGCNKIPPPVAPDTSATPVPGSVWTLAAGAANNASTGWGTCAELNSKLYIIGGNYESLTYTPRRVMESSDAIDWQICTNNAAFPARAGHASVTYDNKLWVAGGSGPEGLLKDVWWSSNGADWYAATLNAAFGGRTDHKMLVFDNKMWLIGGHNSADFQSDVWMSANGSTWTLMAVLNLSHPEFGRRWRFSVLAYGGKMWIIGGIKDIYNGDNYLNDVWYSSNGTTWQTATSHAAFGPRKLFECASFNGFMWVMGGYKDNGVYDSVRYSDLWYSKDGIDWKLATDNVPRCTMFFLMPFNNRLWAISGYSKAMSNVDLNDIYYYEPQ